MMIVWILIAIVSSASAFIDEAALRDLQTIDHWNTFRIVLPHTADECFYLETKSNDTIHVIYQVLRGGDSHVRVIITSPLGEIAFSRADSPFGWFTEDHLKFGGTYRLCFKNEQYFTTKIIYIGVLAVHTDLLPEANLMLVEDKKNNDSAVIDDFTARAMRTFGDMSSTLYQVTAYQTIAHVHHLHDVFSVETNASYVQNWAICQIIAMIVCSMVQVFSIRRLFLSSTSTKPSSTKNYHSPPPSHFVFSS